MTEGLAAARGRRRRWIIASMVVLVLVAAAVGWQVHQHHGVRIGDRFDGANLNADRTTPERRTVPLAFAMLSVSINSGHDADDDGDDVTAPGGATLIEVDWSPAPRAVNAPVWPRATARQRRDPGAELILVSDGRRYPIAKSITTADAGASTVVVVKGDGADAHVETRIAGRTFAAGPSDGYVRLPKPDSDRGCDDTADEVYSWVSCSLPAYRSGYVAGLGVAPVGKEWLIVSGARVTRTERAISVYDGHDGRAEYVPSGPPKVSVTVAGVSAKPRVAGNDEVTGDAVRVAARAWLVDADRSSQVTLRYRLPATIDRPESDWPGAPPHHEVDVSTTTTFPAA